MKRIWSIITLSTICLTTLAVCIGICYFKPANNKPHAVKTKVVHSNNLLGEMNIKDYVNLSDTIIEGEVIKTTCCDWANVIKTPLSDTTIKVTKIFRGIPYNKNEITVRTNYGILNGVNYIPEDSSIFQKHEKVLLFLCLDDSDMVQPDKNYYVIIGSPQGIFSLGTSKKTSCSSNQSITINGKKINLSCLPALINKFIDKNYRRYDKSLKEIKSQRLKKVRQNQKLYQKYLDSKNSVVIY